MKHLILTSIIIIIISGCITSKTKIKLTDVDTGNSVTITDQGLALDVKQLEKDGYEVEIIQEDE